MPSKAPTACRRPGCGGLVVGGICSRCGPVRGLSSLGHELSASRRGYGRAWEKQRKRILLSEPICRLCDRRGLTVPATQVDHVIPKSIGGLDQDDNLQPLCKRCHEAKGVFERRMFRKWRGNRMADIVLVAGPSGAGKTSYVRKNMQADDIMVDLDALVAAITGAPWYTRPNGAWEFALDLRDLVMLRLMRPVNVRRVWFIASLPQPNRRAEFAELLGASRVIVLEVDSTECIRRIATDERRAGQITEWSQVVERWWRDYRRNDGDMIVAW